MQFAHLTLLAAGLVAAQQANAQTQITGAGSTFAAPIYAKWGDASSATTDIS